MTAASPQFSSGRSLYWSLRRELWESRSLYLAPLAAASVFLFGFLLTAARHPAVKGRETIAEPFNMAAGLLMLTAMVVGAFYCLDALQGERRDRSIFFWKSLPVSDTQAVLAKAMIPIVFLPLLTFAITFALQSIMLVVSSAVLWANGLDGGTVWTELQFPRMTLLLLYHLMTVHALGHAPLYGWLLFASAWARRAAFLWAVLPPVAIAAFERMVFGTSYLADVLGRLLTGGGTEAMTPPNMLPIDPMTHLTAGLFLTSPGLWIGLAVTAVFLAASIRLRRERGPNA